MSTRPVALWYPPQTIETRAGFPVTPLAEGVTTMAAELPHYPSAGADSSPASVSATPRPRIRLKPLHVYTL